MIHLAQSDKVPTLTSVVSESLPHLKRGAMRDFLLIMKAHGYFSERRWNRSNFTYLFETGSQIEFFPANSPDKLKGGRRDRLFINEANNVSFNSFDQLEVRTKEFTFIDWNPTNEFWYHSEILNNRKDLEHIILTFLDNEALDQAIVDRILARKNRKGWWQVYGLGQLGEVEGKIYTDWAIIDELPHEARLERYGLDFGYTNDPTAIVAVYYYNGGYIIDELEYKTGISNKNIADLLLNQQKALIVADSAEPKSIDEISSYGLTVTGAVKGQGSVSYGIDVVQEQRISVTRRSVNVIKEYRNFLWKVDINGKTLNVPEDEYKHGMDAISYAMVSIAPIKRRIEQMKIGKKQEERELLKQFDAHRRKAWEATVRK